MKEEEIKSKMILGFNPLIGRTYFKKKYKVIVKIQIKPEFKPKLSENIQDVSNFDEEFTGEGLNNFI